MKIKKKLLILAHYYVPDVASTGQILKELSEGLLKQFEVTVICVVPSYNGVISSEYKKKNCYRENISGVNVIRLKVPEFTKSSCSSRVINILTYFIRGMCAIGKEKNVDYVLSVSQPPVLGGLLGVWGKWRLGASFIYQVQDWNPEQIFAVNYNRNKLILSGLLWIDKFSCRQSSLVITVGRDLVNTLENRFKKNIPKSVVINNWIDEKTIYPLTEENEGVMSFRKKYGIDGKFVIMYSGNIGLYYDLENLIKIIKEFKVGTKTANGKEVVFAFVGDGVILNKLIKYKEKHHMDNVMFIPYQDRSNLIYSLNAGDVHWCVNAKGIKGVSCPSKYYGLTAVGKPVLGVLDSDSEIGYLIESIKNGLCCEPGDYEQVKRNIKWFLSHAGSKELFTMGKRGHDYLIKNLTKEKSIRRYAEEISRIKKD